MILEIRAATDADEAETIALWRACGLVVSYNDPATDYRFAGAKPNSDILVCVSSSEKIIGSAMVGHDGHRGKLYYVAVASDHRSKEIGRAPVQAGEDWLAARGAAKAQLMIREADTDLVAFYQRLGFKTIPRTV
jgi:ribosomal protein S18 acetylase RimI-like enzyme